MNTSSLTKNILLFTMLMALNACGVKPDHVDPPPGDAAKQYPRTYPDPATDPPPNPTVPF